MYILNRNSPHAPQAFNARQTAYLLGSSGQVLNSCFTSTTVQILTQKALLQMWECSAAGPRSMTALVKEQIAAVEEDRKMLITDGTLIEPE